MSLAHTPLWSQERQETGTPTASAQSQLAKMAAEPRSLYGLNLFYVKTFNRIEDSLILLIL